MFAPLLLLASLAPQEPPPLAFARQPSPSPDGRLFAFSHQGDIWVGSMEGGPAVRMTAHPAYDGDPHWSPDGTRIAFESNRNGNRDLYSIPASGGRPERATWYSETDDLEGWWPDGRMLMLATRDRRYGRRGTAAWAAFVDGSEPVRVVDTPMKRPAASPDGRYLAYERGHGDPRRRAYRGSASSALWLYEIATGEHRELTRFEGNDLEPMWGGDSRTLYFLSDRPCDENRGGRNLGLWQTDIDGSTPRLIHHPGSGSLRSPAISRAAACVVAEFEDRLVRVDLATGQRRDIPVHGPLDSGTPDLGFELLKAGASELAISPDGESIAFVANGDLFVTRRHEEIRRCRQVTTDAAPDHSPAWIDEGKAILFVSERDGNAELYRVSPDSPDLPFYRAATFKLTRLTETPQDEWSPTPSPDGERLAWISGNGDLGVGLPDATGWRLLDAGFSEPNFSWSPDSAWLAFDREDDDFNTDIFLVRADLERGDPAEPGVEPWNLTRHPDDDRRPFWSPDGHKIGFTSRRRMNDETDLWLVYLSKGESEKTEQDRLEEADAKAKAKKAKAKKAKAKPKPGKADEPAASEDTPDKKGESAPKQGDSEQSSEEEKKKKPESVKIDFDQLHERILRVTKREGNEEGLAFSHDSKLLYFNASAGTSLTNATQGEKGLWSIELDGEGRKQLEKSNVASLLRHEKALLYTKTGSIVGREGSKTTPYPFSVRVEVDRPALRREVAAQAWRALDRMFYDPAMHGCDWDAARSRWMPLVVAASTPEDMALAMNWMLGELNASHMGFYGKGSSKSVDQQSETTGVLGVIWAPSRGDIGRTVQRVLRDGPAWREASRLAEGDTVLAIDGEPLTSSTNLARIMNGTAGREVRLSVRRSGAEPEAAAESLAIRPVPQTQLKGLLYRDAVAASRAEVHAASGGRLGYIHIQGMGTASLLEFERDLFAEGHGRDGLLIDVRENGGGWTTDMVLAMLEVRSHAITVPRGGGTGYPQGRRVFASWEKPIVVLCNETSYSNAEIFSWAVKTLGRGPVVGKQTYGAVISTGAARLQDGSMVRLPFRGWYVDNEGRTNMELNGCPPDYPVENLPGDWVLGLDRQLEKAVAVGLEQLGAE